MRAQGDGKGARVRRWLLSLWYPGEDVTELLSGLDELAARRRQATGRIRAWVYYWVQFGVYFVVGPVDAMRGVRGDMSYAGRSLVRSPWFGALTTLILSLAVGATIAIFSVVKQVLLEGLPVEDPDRLVAVWLADPVSGAHGRMTPGAFTHASTAPGVFESTAAFSGVSATLLGAGEPRVLRGGRVTPGYLETLGVSPILGRGFLPGEELPDGFPIVILGHRIWTQEYGADPGMVGRTIDMDGTRFEVVGVLPPGVFPTSATLAGEIPFTADNQDYLVPLRYSPEFWLNMGPHVLGAVGRLAPTATLESGEAELGSLMTRLRAEDARLPNERYALSLFRDEVVGGAGTGLWLLLATVGLVFLIAAANVAALFAVRTDDRQGEFGVRVAVGAHRGRLVRQVMLESSAIALAGCVGGLVVAIPGLELMKRMVPYQIARLGETTVDGGVLLVTLGLGAVLALGMGAAAAFRLTDPSGSMLASSARKTTRGVGSRRLQQLVVGMQVGLAIVVLVGASLLVRSFGELRAVDPGFAATNAWTVQLNASGDVVQEVLDRVRAMPGVLAASAGYDHPLQRNWSDGFRIEGHELVEGDTAPGGALRIVREDWFEAAGIRILEGAAFGSDVSRGPGGGAGAAAGGADAAGTARSEWEGVAVINRAFAERYFPNESALGRRISVPTGARMFGEGAVPDWYRIVGVSESVRFLGPTSEPEPALYLPAVQFPTGVSRLLVRPVNTDLEILPAVRAAIREVAPSLPLDNASRMQDELDELVARPRFNMIVIGAFGSLAILLCAIGTYGLVSRVVAAQYRELGIRVALGADRASLTRHVLGSAMWPALVGGVVGIGLALGFGRVIQSMLFGVSPTDPVTFAAVPLVVLGVAIVAALVPMRRVVGVDGVGVLRGE